MKNKLCLFILLSFVCSSASAEYYLVYSPPQCVDCVGPFPAPLNYHSRYKAKHHHVTHHKKASHASYKAASAHIYKERDACGECKTCVCGNGYAISTSQPEYDGEHCTTYEDELQGRQYQ